MKCEICGGSYIVLYAKMQGYEILECAGCGVKFQNPMPGPDYLKKFYDEVDPKYLIKYKSEILRRGRIMLRLAERYGNKGKVLDIGSGLGVFLKIAKKAGWEALGTELSAGAAGYARGQFGAEVMVGDLKDLNLKESSFDLVTMQHVLEHISSPKGFLNAVRSILKENGLLAIAVPNVRSLMAQLAGTNWLCLAERGHLYHYAKDNLIMLLEGSGFSVLKIFTMQPNKKDILWAFKKYMLGEGTKKPFVEILRNAGEGSEILAVARKR